MVRVVFLNLFTKVTSQMKFEFYRPLNILYVSYVGETKQLVDDL